MTQAGRKRGDELTAVCFDGVGTYVVHHSNNREPLSSSLTSRSLYVGLTFSYLSYRRVTPQHSRAHFITFLSYRHRDQPGEPHPATDWIGLFLLDLKPSLRGADDAEPTAVRDSGAQQSSDAVDVRQPESRQREVRNAWKAATYGGLGGGVAAPMMMNTAATRPNSIPAGERLVGWRTLPPKNEVQQMSPETREQIHEL